jgi:hypothetical protein
MSRIVSAMMRLVSYATLFWVAIVPQAFAQTTVTPSSVTSRGVVNLGNNATALGAAAGTNPSTATTTQPTASTTSGTTPAGSTTGSARTGSSAGGGTASAASSASGAPRGGSSSAPSSGGSSASATGTASSNVPAWLLCPPSGASGTEPFVTGTNLSCAP